MSVPIFVVPPTPVAPRLHWTARRSPKGQLDFGMAKDIAAYVLPGQQRTLVLKSAAPSLFRQPAAF
jgi:hypothetical protein